MTEDIKRKMRLIRLLTNGDDSYHRMLQECRSVERQYLTILESLPDRDREMIENYLALCEAMSWRMLEIACEYTDRPE